MSSETGGESIADEAAALEATWRAALSEWADDQIEAAHDREITTRPDEYEEALVLRGMARDAERMEVLIPALVAGVRERDDLAGRVATLEAENAALRAAINDAIPRMRQAVDEGDPDSLFFVEDDLRSALRDDAGGGRVTDRTSNEDRSET